MGVESLVELGNVRVAKLLDDFNLSFDSLPPVWFKELKFLVNLAGYFLLGLLVEADAHHCICTLTDSFSNDIVVKVIRGAALCPELVLLLRQSRIEAIILLQLGPSWRASEVIRRTIVRLIFLVISRLVICQRLHFVSIIINIVLLIEKMVFVKSVINSVGNPCTSLCVVK